METHQYRTYQATCDEGTSVELGKAASRHRPPPREIEDRDVMIRRARLTWFAIITIAFMMFSLMAICRNGSADLFKRIQGNAPFRFTAFMSKPPTSPSDLRIRTKATSSKDVNTDTDAVEYTEAAMADKINALPGLSEAIVFEQFAGYLDISESKKVFYWYVEAQTAPSSAPLLLWTNGGPGCSGLFGALNENGPFRPNTDGKTVSINPDAWNNVAHMLYVEIPVGVGFSYSKDKSEYDIGDVQTAADNYVLIQQFYARFPHLRSHDFYLTSESYGGHYLPTLAKKIIEMNEGGKREAINLKGFAVGNPYTDPLENMVGMFDSLWGHQLIPETLYMTWKTQCRERNTLETYYSKTCTDLANQMWTEVGDVDPYALDYPVCKDDSETGSHLTHKSKNPSDKKSISNKRPLKAAGRNQRYKLFTFSLARALPAHQTKSSWSNIKKGLDFQPCEDDYSTNYLNQPEVKAAIHAQADIVWSDCSDTLKYQYEDENVYMEPLYKYFVEEYKKLRILIYSGDDDSVCATRGSQFWIDSMGWKITTDWDAWEVNDQVAGYMKTYEDGLFSFVTVHGAGHEVPTYRPEAALALITSFLQDIL